VESRSVSLPSISSAEGDSDGMYNAGLAVREMARDRTGVREGLTGPAIEWPVQGDRSEVIELADWARPVEGLTSVSPRP
jgi:hypothetical protein